MRAYAILPPPSFVWSSHGSEHTYTREHIRYAGMAMTLAEKERKDLRQACCQGSLSSEPQRFRMGIV